MESPRNLLGHRSGMVVEWLAPCKSVWYGTADPTLQVPVTRQLPSLQRSLRLDRRRDSSPICFVCASGYGWGVRTVSLRNNLIQVCITAYLNLTPVFSTLPETGTYFKSIRYMLVPCQGKVNVRKHANPLALLALSLDQVIRCVDLNSPLRRTKTALYLYSTSMYLF